MTAHNSDALARAEALITGGAALAQVVRTGLRGAVYTMHCSLSSAKTVG